MSASYLSACASRAVDTLLHNLIARRLTYDSGCWRIDCRGLAGRTLVAACDLPPCTLVFTEMPIVVAPGGSVAVAKKVLALDRAGDDFAAATQLQSRAERAVDGWGPWAAGLAAINVHGAGGTMLGQPAPGVAMQPFVTVPQPRRCISWRWPLPPAPKQFKLGCLLSCGA